jgi:hypothetical protein
MARRRTRADRERCAEKALQFGEDEDMDKEDESDEQGDNDNDDNKKRTSRRKSKGKAKAAEAEKEKPKKKAAPRARAKGKAKEAVAEPELELEPEPELEPTAATAPGELGDSMPGVEPGPSTSAISPKRGVKAILPKTVQEAELKLTKFDAARHGILDEMDPEFDEQINSLLMSSNPDIVAYYDLELERWGIQKAAIERTNRGSALPKELIARGLQLKEARTFYQTYVAANAENDGAIATQAAEAAGGEEQWLPNIGDLDFSFHSEEDVNMYPAAGTGERLDLISGRMNEC